MIRNWYNQIPHPALKILYKLYVLHSHSLTKPKWCYVPNEDSDQPEHQPSDKSSLSAWRNRVLRCPLSTQQRLIRLGRCPGWSESSLGVRHFIGFVMLQLIYAVLCFSLKKDSKVYFYTSFIAYFMALLMTILIMHFFKHAQVRLLNKDINYLFLAYYVTNLLVIISASMQILQKERKLLCEKIKVTE